MGVRLVDSYLSKLEVRRTVRNWPSEVRSVVDGYREHTTISHALQKDAIQNGWSARRYKKGRDWMFTFELVSSGKKSFLVMTDYGTTGLTGRVLKPEEYEMDLPGEEKWGRFEGVAFTQPRGERTLGSRGRGKFIFVGASKEHTILYDTVRSDGSYRFGFRTVNKTESPVVAYDDDEGRNLIEQMTDDLFKPLTDVGTRVIIVNPLDEVIDDFKNGRLIRYIGETWWGLILKHNAAIKLRNNGTEIFATIPEEFDLSDEESEHIKIWKVNNHSIRVGLETVRIKNLHIVSKSNKQIPEDLRGIAIQRSGMKICSIEPRYLSRDVAHGIYGYINFDSDTEEALLADEGIEHYSFDFRKSIPGAIKRFVEDELMRFAQEKLGYGVNKRELQRQQQRNAERRALTAVNNFARALGIGAGPSGGGGGGGGGKPKKIRIQMTALSLPRPSDLRVNYGETVSDINIRVVNDNERDIDFRVKFFLRFYDKLIKVFDECDIQLVAGSKSDYIGPFEETFSESNYPDKGKYTVVAKIISLAEEDKGIELDYKTKSFYLEEEPPKKGIFERIEAFGFPDEEPLKYWIGYSEFGSEKGLILYYNLDHPGYFVISQNEEDLAEYILRIAGPELCRYDLMQKEPLLFKEEQKEDPQEILKQERNVLGELVYKFRRGEI